MSLLSSLGLCRRSPQACKQQGKSQVILDYELSISYSYWYRFNRNKFYDAEAEPDRGAWGWARGISRVLECANAGGHTHLFFAKVYSLLRTNHITGGGPSAQTCHSARRRMRASARLPSPCLRSRGADTPVGCLLRPELPL